MGQRGRRKAPSRCPRYAGDGAVRIIDRSSLGRSDRWTTRRDCCCGACPSCAQAAWSRSLPNAASNCSHCSALKSGEWVPRDRIAALLWPEHSNIDARRNLRNVVFKAREVPGTGQLEASEHALRWTVPTDLQAFERALREQGAPDALPLRRGPPLAGLDDPRNDALGAWLAEERRRLEAHWHDAALEHLASLPDPVARRALAQQLLQIDPLDEAAVALWIEAALALGQTGAAQQVFRDYRQRLAEDLGVEPSRRLRDLLSVASALDADSAAAVVAAAQPSPQDDGFVGRRAGALRTRRPARPAGWPARDTFLARAASARAASRARSLERRATVVPRRRVVDRAAGPRRSRRPARAAGRAARRRPRRSPRPVERIASRSRARRRWSSSTTPSTCPSSARSPTACSRRRPDSRCC